MNDFQQKLDEEIEKRELEEDENQQAQEVQPSKNKNSFFSFGAFLKGLAACSILFALIFGWAVFKASDTNQMMQEKLASKTAVVEKAQSNTYRVGDAQPVLRMPSAREDNNTAQQQVEIPKPAVSGGPNALAPAPIPGLYEPAPSGGLLPAPRQEDNLTPFEAYKRPFRKNIEQPVLSVVVTDLGISRNKTEELIKKLPPEVSLGFSPYARDLKLLTDVARNEGHEVWLTLPLETRDFPLDDPGPSTLLVNASVEQNKSRLTDVLSSTQGYVGFISQKNHVFRQEDAEINPAIQEIFDRGLAVLDSNTSVSSFVGRLAGQKDFPHAKNNFWLDENMTPVMLNQKIRQMMEYGKGSGSVVMMLRPYPASIQTLEKFLNSAAAKEFQIAPVSAQVIYGE